MDGARTTQPVPAVLSLSPARRRHRLAASAVVVALLLAGSAWGQDDAFPFGPFRMFATKQRLDGATSWYTTVGVTADGAQVEIPIGQVGLRRAELEGQMDRLRADPALIELLVDAYERREPTAPRLVEMRIVKHVQPVRAGVPHGDPVERIVVTWRR